ncbi:MAG: hypothetical protein ABSA80_20005 [Terriglobales bacterium]|jgi:hypothetical protein
MSCAIFTILGAYVFYADKSNRWALGATGILAVLCLLIACYLAWADEYKKVQKYLDDGPRLGLYIVSFFGRKEWQEQADSKNTPVHISIEHLGGRIPTDVRFDPIQSKKGTWTLCFGSESYVKPPVRLPLSYEIREKGANIDQRIIDHLGWGTFLLSFVNDTDPQPEQDEYLLTVRYKDGDAERTQVFKLVFDKTKFGFLSNTMHL